MRYFINFTASSLLFTILIHSVYFCNVLSAPAKNGKPVLAIVPAAWHAPVHYSAYIHQLRSAGYATVTERLPSCGSPNPRAQSVAVDAAFIRERLLMPAISAGKEVVVIMHSYSGGPGAMAAEGLSVAERHAAGQVGGVVGLIFISAFIAEEGQTLVSGGGFAPWVIEHPNGQLSVKNPKEVFYNGVPDSLANRAVHDLRDQARNSAVTPCGPPAWSNPFYNGRRAFVRCTLDNAIPPFAQDAMLQNSGVQWEIQDFATGHAPFLSQPRRLAMWTDRTIEKFQAVRNEDTVATA